MGGVIPDTINQVQNPTAGELIGPKGKMSIV